MICSLARKIVHTFPTQPFCSSHFYFSFNDLFGSLHVCRCVLYVACGGTAASAAVTWTHRCHVNKRQRAVFFGAFFPLDVDLKYYRFAVKWQLENIIGDLVFQPAQKAFRQSCQQKKIEKHNWCLGGIPCKQVSCSFFFRRTNWSQLKEKWKWVWSLSSFFCTWCRVSTFDVFSVHKFRLVLLMHLFPIHVTEKKKSCRVLKWDQDSIL